MTIGRQLKEMFRNAPASNPRKYLERLVDELLNEIAEEMSKEFSKDGIGCCDGYDFGTIYARVERLIYRRYRRRCTFKDFCTVFNKKIREDKRLKIDKDLCLNKLSMRLYESWYGEYKRSWKEKLTSLKPKFVYQSNFPRIYWGSTEKVDIKFAKRYLRRYFRNEISKGLVEQVKKAQKVNIVLEGEIFTEHVYIPAEKKIDVLKKFFDDSNETIVNILEEIAKDEEISFEAIKLSDGDCGYHLIFSVSFEGKL